MTQPEPPTPPTLEPSARAAIVAERIEQLRRLLREVDARGVLLDTRRDFAWLTLGGTNHVVLASETGAAPLLVTVDEAAVLAPVNEAPRIAAEEVDGLPLEVRSLAWWDDPSAAASEMARGRLVRGTDVAARLEELRTVLGSEEHARLEWLGGLVSGTVDGVLASVSRGATEQEVTAEVAAALARQAARTPVLLAAADDRIDRFRHPLPTDLAVTRRLMVVAVVERWGLHAAYTGILELEPPPPEIEQRRDGLVHVLAAMRDATVVGGTLGGVLDAARTAYAAVGLEAEWRLHHQGGSIGYGPRERVATLTDRTAIRPGMAFAWNPSAVGYKLEETLYLDADGGQHVVATNGPGSG